MDKYTEKILSNKKIFTVFYTEYCPYSIKAINLLKIKNLEYKSYIINDMDKILSNLNKNKHLTGFKSSHKTKPIIFFDTQFIGGYQELLKFT
tara:strand:- start:544 stop:819 length:276 start_codon:yes stop_codon:yes gene_type:complete